MSPLSQIYQRLPGQPYLVHNDAEGNDGVVGKTDNDVMMGETGLAH